MLALESMCCLSPKKPIPHSANKKVDSRNVDHSTENALRKKLCSATIFSNRSAIYYKTCSQNTSNSKIFLPKLLMQAWRWDLGSARTNYHSKRQKNMAALRNKNERVWYRKRKIPKIWMESKYAKIRRSTENLENPRSLAALIVIVVRVVMGTCRTKSR